MFRVNSNTIICFIYFCMILAVINVTQVVTRKAWIGLESWPLLPVQCSTGRALHLGGASTAKKLWGSRTKNEFQFPVLIHGFHVLLTVILQGRTRYELIYITNEAVGRVGYYQLISCKSEKNNCFSKFSSNSIDFSTRNFSFSLFGQT